MIISNIQKKAKGNEITETFPKKKLNNNENKTKKIFKIEGAKITYTKIAKKASKCRLYWIVKNIRKNIITKLKTSNINHNLFFFKNVFYV